MKKIVPIRFERVVESGGSTKPWLVTAVQEGLEDPEEITYVVKLFSESNIIQGNNIGKEFFCNELAIQFDLDVPEAAFITLNDPNFRSTLKSEELETLSMRYEGGTFASRLAEGSLVNEQLRESPFTIHDCATLFAFDCLILNTDRGGFRNKPNLLMNDDGLILIDHELTFNFIDSADQDAYDRLISQLADNRWPEFYEKHIFYNKLKSYKGSKKALFDTFEESLRTLDLKKIQHCITDLEDRGISLGQSDLLIDYLRTLKQNSSKFRTILLGLIS
ncbi:MAG: hypothetical protein K9G42_12020 [Pedobacter sp.]|nr:hypothetical protein [Pedobacter sp.]